MQTGVAAIKEVIKNGLCTACGACVDICPYIKSIYDRVAVIEDCGLKEGRCYYFCPRIHLDTGYADRNIGRNISIFAARAAEEEIRKNAQYGGVVSAILAHALESGEIEAAALTRASQWNPQPTIARNKEEVLACGKTKYMATTTLSVVNKAIREGVDKIGIVGTPCQVEAARKMQLYEKGKIGIIIGLFCMWALSYDFYRYLKTNVDISTVTRLDIPIDGFLVYTGEGDSGSSRMKKLSLDEVKGFIRPACDFCFDMTSELADISIGAVEGVEDWNTVIIRTKEGERLIKEVIERGIMEERELEPERIEHLKEASRNKKARALARIEKMKMKREGIHLWG